MAKALYTFCIGDRVRVRSSDRVHESYWGKAGRVTSELNAALGQQAVWLDNEAIDAMWLVDSLVPETLPAEAQPENHGALKGQ